MSLQGMFVRAVQHRRRRTRHVWIVTSGDYELYGIDLVAESLEAAVHSLKVDYYDDGYVRTWDEPILRSDGHVELTCRYRDGRESGFFWIDRWEVA